MHDRDIVEEKSRNSLMENEIVKNGISIIFLGSDQLQCVLLKTFFCFLTEIGTVVSTCFSNDFLYS